MADLSPVQSDFVQTYGPLARDIAGRTGLDPSVVLGQIAQETGWGARVAGNNIFGISPVGPDGKQIVQAYPDVQTAANDYVRLIQSRYTNATAQKTPEAQAQALAKAGYNTVNPTYGASVASLASTIRPALNAATRPSDTDMASAWGLGEKTGTAATPPRPSDDDLAKQWGIEAPKNDNTPAVATQPSTPVPTPITPPSVAPAVASAPPPAASPPPSNQALSDVISSPAAVAADIPQSQTPNPALGRIVNAATEAYRGTPSILTPQAQAAVDRGGPVGRWLVNPALRAAGGVLAGANALGTGAASAVNETANALGVPALGRDVNMLMQVGPVAHMGAGLPNVTAVTEAAPPRFMQEYYGEGTPANPLAAKPLLPAPAFVPPNANLPAPIALEAPAVPAFIPPNAIGQPPNSLTPSPLGTAKPNPLITAAPEPTPLPAAPTSLTTKEAAEYAAIPEKLPPAPKIPPVTQAQADARADQLIQHFASTKGVPSEQDLVPNFVPTLAQATGDPGIATLERGVQAANPGALDLRKAANQKAIRDYTDQVVGTPGDIAAAQAERDAVTTPMRDAAFSNKSDVDAAPVESLIDRTLAGPDGKRTAVRNTLENVRKSLHVEQDTDQPLESDPEQLYGVRKHVNDLLSPAAQRENPELQRAASTLGAVKDQLDQVIEKGAPGFKDYIDRYSELSRPIDEKQYLQGLNLTDQDGNVRGASIDAALKTINKLQRAPGANKASSISDDTMAALARLQNTLRAQRLSETAGKTIGSNTFQNLATNSTVGAVAGNPLVNVALAGVGGGLSGGPLGAMIGAGAGMAARGLTHHAETMVRRAIIERILNLQGKGVAALGSGNGGTPP